MKYHLLIIAGLVGAPTTGALAQPHGTPAPRTLQYEPGAGGDFFCVNGHNRYTRALYGSHILVGEDLMHVVLRRVELRTVVYHRKRYLHRALLIAFRTT